LEIIPITKVEQSKMQPLEVKPHMELMGEEVIIANSKVGTKPLVVVQVGTTKIYLNNQERFDCKCFHFIFCDFISISGP
jgi:hypothetical protein